MLSQDSLGFIFSYLSINSRHTTERVCRRWKSVSTKSTNLIKTLTIDEDTNMKYIDVILARKGIGGLKSLQLSINDTPAPHTLPVAALRQTTFNSSVLPICNAASATHSSTRDTILRRVSVSCKNLKCLKLDSCTTVDFDSLINIIKNGNLRYITLNTWSYYVLENISIYCKKLEYILIKSCIDSEGFNFIIQCEKLKSIRLFITTLCDEDFKDISSKCKELKYLEISKGISDVGVGYISQLRFLKAFYTHYDYITSEGFRCINECTELIKLGLSMVNYVNLSSISSNIESIRFCGCGITDAELDYIFQKCNLQKIILTCCESLSDEGFKNIPINVKFLSINNCSGITSMGLKNILKKCTELKEIHIVNCVGIKVLIFERNTSIEEIIIRECDLNNGLRDIVKCVNLKRLYIARCNVSTREMENIVDNCRNLKYIYARIYNVENNFIKECKLMNIECNFYGKTIIMNDIW